MTAIFLFLTQFATCDLQTAKDEIARCVHQMIVLLDDFALFIPCGDDPNRVFLFARLGRASPRVVWCSPPSENPQTAATRKTRTKGRYDLGVHHYGPDAVGLVVEKIGVLEVGDPVPNLMISDDSEKRDAAQWFIQAFGFWEQLFRQEKLISEALLLLDKFKAAR